MVVMVIDVAAQHSGAATVLNQYIEEFKKHPENDYIVVLSLLKYDDLKNVKFINYEWIKKTYFHRLWFDKFYIKKLISLYKPEVLLSLQNCAYSISDVKQEVLFHNALPISEKKYSFSQSKIIWLYQNVIGKYWKKSLNNAQIIYVQAEWIKNKMVNQWGISNDSIVVKPPTIDKVFYEKHNRIIDDMIFFYPANGSIYKNHDILLSAFFDIWDGNPLIKPSLIITCDIKCFCKRIRDRIKIGNYPIIIKQNLSKQEMIEYYCKSILIFPSLIETVGLPLLEAKALKSKILVADCEYAHESLGDYQNVRYFNAEDKESVRAALLEQIMQTSNI